MLTIGDFNISGEIVLAIVLAVAWISSAIAAIVTKNGECLGAPLIFSILAGIGYMFFVGK